MAASPMGITSIKVLECIPRKLANPCCFSIRKKSQLATVSQLMVRMQKEQTILFTALWALSIPSPLRTLVVRSIAMCLAPPVATIPPRNAVTKTKYRASGSIQMKDRLNIEPAKQFATRNYKHLFKSETTTYSPLT